MSKNNNGFNRYIVECKLAPRVDVGFLAVGFNRYIVECKYSRICVSVIKIIGFNRYIVECKYRSCIYSSRATVLI